MTPEQPIPSATLRNQRSISRAFARMAATEDGKRIIAHIEAVTGWDEAGPPSGDDNPLQFWTGQRSVVKLFRDQISKGKKLLANPDTEDDEH